MNSKKIVKIYFLGYLGRSFRMATIFFHLDNKMNKSFFDRNNRNNKES